MTRIEKLKIEKAQNFLDEAFKIIENTDKTNENLWCSVNSAQLLLESILEKTNVRYLINDKEK